MTTYTPKHRAEVPTDLCPCGFVDCHICPQTGGRHRAEGAS